MTDWLWPRFTASGNLLHYLHFDEKQVARGLADKVRIGDRALFYQTGTLGGAKAIVASVEITGELEGTPIGDPTRRGGRDWNQRRSVRVRVTLPDGLAQLGVPLPDIRKILGWKSGATVRQAIRILPDAFDTLEAALNRRVSGLR